MSNEVRIGGVTVRFNEDGTLYLYQPDSSRLMSEELAGDLIDWLVTRYEPMQTPASDAEASNLAAMREEFGLDVQPPVAAPVKRQPGRPRKTAG